jgi:hypothetical protein
VRICGNPWQGNTFARGRFINAHEISRAASAQFVEEMPDVDVIFNQMLK